MSYLMSPKEVTSLFEVSTPTILKYTRLGCLVAFFINPRTIRYSDTYIRRLLKGHETGYKAWRAIIDRYKRINNEQKKQDKD